MTDPYTVLGVPHDATPREITRAYRRQLRIHHPDTRCDADADTRTDDGAALGEILRAYRLLRDPSARAAYDRRSAGVRVRADHVQPVAPPLWVGPVRRHSAR